METLVLVVEAEGWDLRALALILEQAALHITRSKVGAFLEVAREGSSAYVCVLRPGDEEGLFDDWPEALIPDRPFTAISIDYRRPALAESIVTAVSGRARAVVDTNFGDVLSARDFLARADQEPESWHWQRG